MLAVLWVLGYTYQISGSVPRCPSTLTSSSDYLIVSSQACEIWERRYEDVSLSDTLGWMACMLVLSFPSHLPHPSLLCCKRWLTLQISFLSAVKGECRNCRVGCKWMHQGMCFTLCVLPDPAPAVQLPCFSGKGCCIRHSALNDTLLETLRDISA